MIAFFAVLALFFFVTISFLIATRLPTINGKQQQQEHQQQQQPQEPAAAPTAVSSIADRSTHAVLPVLDALKASIDQYRVLESALDSEMAAMQKRKDRHVIARMDTEIERARALLFAQSTDADAVQLFVAPPPSPCRRRCAARLCLGAADRLWCETLLSRCLSRCRVERVQYSLSAAAEPLTVPLEQPRRDELRPFAAVYGEHWAAHWLETMQARMRDRRRTHGAPLRFAGHLPMTEKHSFCPIAIDWALDEANVMMCDNEAVLKHCLSDAKMLHCVADDSVAARNFNTRLVRTTDAYDVHLRRSDLLYTPPVSHTVPKVWHAPDVHQVDWNSVFVDCAGCPSAKFIDALLEKTTLKLVSRQQCVCGGKVMRDVALVEHGAHRRSAFYLAFARAEWGKRSVLPPEVYDAIAAAAVPLIVTKSRHLEELPFAAAVLSADFATSQDFVQYVELMSADKDLWLSHHRWRREQADVQMLRESFERHLLSNECKVALKLLYSSL